jgi:hypothetical protein
MWGLLAGYPNDPDILLSYLAISLLLDGQTCFAIPVPPHTPQTIMERNYERPMCCTSRRQLELVLVTRYLLELAPLHALDSPTGLSFSLHNRHSITVTPISLCALAVQPVIIHHVDSIS